MFSIQNPEMGAQEQPLAQIDAAEFLHGFTTAVVCAGSNANSDGGLGAVHESKRAIGVRSTTFTYCVVVLRSLYHTQFFEARCRANLHTILSHMKAHVLYV